MATVNTASVREEIARVEQEIARLSETGKVSDESRMLFNTLLMIVNMLVAIFMERSTKKTSKNSSKNSSIPPSQTTEDQSSKASASNKKGPAQNDESFDNSRTVETKTVAGVKRCSACGENLSQVSVTDYERRTRIDIVFEKRVEHVDAEIKHCPCCHHVTKGQFPSDLAGPVQYGLGIKAYILNLLITQMVSLNRVQKLLKTLIGRAISEAVMLKYILQLHVALEAWEQDAIRQLLASPVMHVDETSMRLDKKNHWVHVCSAGDITLKRLHAKRGSVAMDEINTWAAPSSLAMEGSSFTTAGPPISAITSLRMGCADHICSGSSNHRGRPGIDSNGYAWAKNMKRLLKETCAKVSKRKRKKLTENAYANLQKRYRNILTRGISELPARPDRPSGKRGRLAQSDAQNLWDRMYQHEYAVLLFAYNAEVPFTNNRAERDLRMGKVKQKVSGCFRQEQYAAAYCRISSYLQTMAYRGYNPLVAIQLALTGKLTTAGV